MPPAKQMEVLPGTSYAMDLAARRAERVRLRGTVVASQVGRSGRYSNRTLHVRCGEVAVCVTATQTSPLGTSSVGTELDLVCTLTGMLDLTQNLYFGKNAQLLAAGSTVPSK